MSDAVELTIEIAAQPSTVVRFLTDPDWFARWMGGRSSLNAGDGTFSVVYPNGDRAVGRIVEKDARRVVYAWGYAEGRHGLAPGSTRVVFELHETGSGTRLALRHEGLPTPRLRQDHLQGWTFYTAQLAAAAAAAQVGAALPDRVAAWVRSWNEDDAGARARQLEEAVERDVVYRDRMAVVHGRDALTSHIGGTRAYAPGLTLELVGRPRHVHGCATFDWRIVDASGAPFASGSCFGELSLDGRFRSLVGFWNE